MTPFFRFRKTRTPGQARRMILTCRKGLPVPCRTGLFLLYRTDPDSQCLPTGRHLPDPILRGPILRDPCLQGPILPDPCPQGPILRDPCLQGPILRDPCLQGPILRDLCLHGRQDLRRHGRRGPFLPGPRPQDQILPDLTGPGIGAQSCRESSFPCRLHGSDSTTQRSGVQSRFT